MTGALAGKPAVDFPQPDTVVSVLIDPATKQVATPDCPVKQAEFYIKDTEPTQPCEKHGQVNPEPAVLPFFEQ